MLVEPSDAWVSLRGAFVWECHCALMAQMLSSAVNRLPSFFSQVLRLIQEPSDELMAVLGKIDAWQFDSFELDAVTKSRPLSALAFAMFKRLNLIPGRWA